METEINVEWCFLGFFFSMIGREERNSDDVNTWRMDSNGTRYLF